MDDNIDYLLAPVTVSLCLLNFVFGNQNLNLVASMTTSVIKVADRKFSGEENVEFSISKLAYRRGH
jgi:hypothetical protein